MRKYNILTIAQFDSLEIDEGLMVTSVETTEDNLAAKTAEEINSIISKGRLKKLAIDIAELTPYNPKEGE